LVFWDVKSLIKKRVKGRALTLSRKPPEEVVDGKGEVDVFPGNEEEVDVFPGVEGTTGAVEGLPGGNEEALVFCGFAGKGALMVLVWAMVAEVQINRVGIKYFIFLSLT
jgi:hypothetical protein